MGGGDGGGEGEKGSTCFNFVFLMDVAKIKQGGDQRLC
jgi:hypothetical protein